MLLFNDTLGMNVSKTTSLSARDQFGLPLSHGATIVAINFLLSITGTFGNFLIILAVFKTPQLRQRPSNRLLLSLAVADLVVTMVVQPLFATATALKTFKYKCNSSLESVHRVASPFSCSSSAFHLAAISIDRLISVVKPHRHREIMKKWSKIMLAICWGIAIILGSLLDIFPVVNYVGVVLIILCEVVMISSYGVILYKIKRSHKMVVTASSSTASERAIENRLSGTIAIVILLFAACWFPLVGYSFSHPVEDFVCAFDMKLNWVTTVLLANSSMNFIVYSLRIRLFRTAYIRITRSMLQSFVQVVGKCRSKRPLHQNTPYHKSPGQQNMDTVPTADEPRVPNEVEDANEMIQIQSN